MKLHIYAIYDTAAAHYKSLWEQQTDAQAMREFGDIFAKENQISQHPEDYYLVRFGSWNNNTGKFDIDAPETLMTGLEAIALANQKAQKFGNGSELPPELRAIDNG